MPKPFLGGGGAARFYSNLSPGAPFCSNEAQWKISPDAEDGLGTLTRILLNALAGALALIQICTRREVYGEA